MLSRCQLLSFPPLVLLFLVKIKKSGGSFGLKRPRFLSSCCHLLSVRSCEKSPDLLNLTFPNHKLQMLVMYCLLGCGEVERDVMCVGYSPFAPPDPLSHLRHLSVPWLTFIN